MSKLKSAKVGAKEEGSADARKFTKSHSDAPKAVKGSVDVDYKRVFGSYAPKAVASDTITSNTIASADKAPTRIGRGSQTASILEASGSGSGNKLEEIEELRTEKNYSACVYLTLMVLLMLITMALVGGATFFEIEATKSDKMWNDIYQNKKPFPNSISGDKYFGAKRIKDIPKFRDVILNKTNKINPKMLRNRTLELVSVGFCTLIFTVAVIHLVLCIAFRDVRQNYKVTFVLYGLAGVILFLVGMFFCASSMGVLNAAFLHVRQELEVQVRKGHKVSNHHDGHNQHHQHEHDIQSMSRHDVHFHEILPKHCFADSKSAYADELRWLLNMSKMCAYRFTSMNSKDPCRNKTRVPDPELIILGKKYTVKDLENIHFCPNDRLKLITAGMCFTAAISSLLVSWIASWAHHNLLVPHLYNHKLVWQHVARITGWMPRKLPSLLNIEHPSRPSAVITTYDQLEAENNEDLDVSNLEPTASPLIRRSWGSAGRAKVRMSAISDDVPLRNTSSQNQVGRRGYVPPPSVMQIAPDLIIRAPLIKSPFGPALSPDDIRSIAKETRKLREKAAQNWFQSD